MKVIEKFQTAIAEGEPLEWEKLRTEIDMEHAQSRTPQERENLLAVFTVMMDMVERIEFTPETRAKFAEERRRDYHRMLLREACLDGRLCDQTLFDVSTREVMKGFMAQDDPIHIAAVAAVSRPEQRADATVPAELMYRDAGPASGRWRRLLAHLSALSNRLDSIWHRALRNRAL